jgi:hypothetical protein
MSIREATIKALKKHKSGWIYLGENLINISEKELWRDWGFSDFADYCKGELGITSKTASDMMSAYSYIKENEPSVLNTVETGEGDAKYIPDYYSVNILSKAAERGGEERKDDIDRLHKQLFDSEAGSRGTSKEIKDFLKECKGGKTGDVTDEIAKETKSVKRLAKKLVDKLTNTSAFSPEIIEAAERLEKMIEEVAV